MKPEEFIEWKFKYFRDTPGDINEHMECLYEHARECSSIIELGVRECVSSWAFAKGLLENEKPEKKLLLVDKDKSPVEPLLGCCQGLIDVSTYWGNDLTLQLTENYDMVFIDTWHVYAQLKRELEHFAPRCNKYIIMHDTTIDAEKGEAIRYGENLASLSITSGFPVEEIGKGIWPAVEEFVAGHPEWVIADRFTHNNGLTVLRRIT